LQSFERSDFATLLTQALDGAYGQSGDLMDFTVFERGAVKSFVGEEQRYGRHGFGGLAALMVADGFEVFALEFR